MKDMNNTWVYMWAIHASVGYLVGGDKGLAIGVLIAATLSLIADVKKELRS